MDYLKGWLHGERNGTRGEGREGGEVEGDFISFIYLYLFCFVWLKLIVIIVEKLEFLRKKPLFLCQNQLFDE